MITFKTFEHKNIKYESLLSTKKIEYQYICKFSMSCETLYPNMKLNYYDITIYLNNNFNLIIGIYDVLHEEHILTLYSDNIFAEKINKKILLEIIQEKNSINWMINNIGLNVIDDLTQCLDMFFQHIDILKIAGI